MSALILETEKPGLTAGGGSPNFDLVFSRLEKEIIDGRKPELCGQILRREDIWKGVEPVRQLKWARLAQMAGEVDTALKVLATINKEVPKLKEAWEERISLLSVLDRQAELAAALAASQGIFGEESGRWVVSSPKMHDASDAVADSAAAPFENLRQRQELLRHYLDLFSGREDCFARQWADRAEGKQGYVPVKRAMEPADVEDHLGGRKTYGIYLVRYEGSVKLAVLDLDLKQEYRGGKLKADDRDLVRREGAYLFSRIREFSAKLGVEPLVEFSGGKGFHFWFILESPVSPELARKALGGIQNALAGDLKAFTLEVFPKQDKLSGKGLGNLVKLPLGIHRLTGKRSYFLSCADRSPEAQLRHLDRIKASGVERLLQFSEAGRREKVFPHPRLQKRSAAFPELSTLETCCPPLGQIIASCLQGKAISNTEERVLLQTVGFLKRARTLVHHLLANVPEYNPHLVDFKLSRLRGTPLGCRRIHSILGFTADLCSFQGRSGYEQPLLHLPEADSGQAPKAEQVENLASALANLKLAIMQVQRLLV